MCGGGVWGEECIATRRERKVKEHAQVFKDYMIASFSFLSSSYYPYRTCSSASIPFPLGLSPQRVVQAIVGSKYLHLHMKLIVSSCY